MGADRGLRFDWSTALVIDPPSAIHDKVATAIMELFTRHGYAATYGRTLPRRFEAVGLVDVGTRADSLQVRAHVEHGLPQWELLAAARTWSHRRRLAHFRRPRTLPRALARRRDGVLRATDGQLLGTAFLSPVPLRRRAADHHPLPRAPALGPRPAPAGNPDRPPLSTL